MMAKYSKELENKLVSLIEEDTYTITDICKILNIGRKTFYRWRDDKPEFAEAISTAMENREERMRLLARQAMKKRLDGYKLVETKTVYATNKNAEDGSEMYVKEYVVKDKYCVPDTSAIAFALSDGSRGAKKVAMESKSRPLSIVVNDAKVKSDLNMLKENLEAM